MSRNVHVTKDSVFSRRRDEGGLRLCTQGTSKVPITTRIKYMELIFRAFGLILAVIAEKLCL